MPSAGCKTPDSEPFEAANAWQTLRKSPVSPQAWFDLASDYRVRDLPWQAAYAARQAVRCDPTLHQQIENLGLDAWHDAKAGDGQLGRATLAHAEALAEKFAAAAAEQPNDWLTWLYLARLYEIADPARGERHSHALIQAQALEIMPGETLHWLGVWRLQAGDAAGAVAALSSLLDIRPIRHGSMMTLGEALLRIGNTAAAEKAFSRASLSSNPDFLLTLSSRVYAHNYWREAIAVLRNALELRPTHIPTWLALARIQSEVYELADCRTSLDRIRRLDPDNSEAALLEAGLQGRLGDARAHFEQLSQAYANGGDPLSRLASSIAMTSLYQDHLAPAEVAALHRGLCAPIERSVVPHTSFHNDKTPQRRLRIGYVTGDLHRQHPVNLFLLPMFKWHDHQQFDIAVYYTGVMHDGYTAQARDCADHWLEASGLDDSALHQAILSDQIDLLIDLAGHTATHRLGVFAQRAAPVQATFLGYPYSTGLASIDWLIGDRIVTPAAHADLYSEGLAQLPHSVFCWAPVDEHPLPPARPHDAAPVFGSFNNAMKLTPKTIALWSDVLKAVPDARLLLKAPSLGDADVQARFAAQFSQHGIELDRIEFRGPSGLADMMQEYGDIDIALDPLPYNGGTTTLQALWMGVPVLTLAGGNFVSRMGASFLTSLDKSAWIATDAADYIDKAKTLAGQIAPLRRERSGLRQELLDSPLTDIATYTKDIEALYRRMWVSHTKGESAKRLLAH
jgi:protein O-GlcNAc transferase